MGRHSPGEWGRAGEQYATLVPRAQGLPAGPAGANDERGPAQAEETEQPPLGAARGRLQPPPLEVRGESWSLW